MEARSVLRTVGTYPVSGGARQVLVVTIEHGDVDTHVVLDLPAGENGRVVMVGDGFDTDGAAYWAAHRHASERERFTRAAAAARSTDTDTDTDRAASRAGAQQRNPKGNGLSSYHVTTYPTARGDRDVLLVALPSDHDAWALVDARAGARGLDSDARVVARRLPDLEAAGVTAEAHVLLSVELGYPATGEPIDADGSTITVPDLLAITAAQCAHAASVAATRDA